MKRFHLSLGDLTGLLALILAGLLLFLAPVFFPVPLVLFLILCLIAPFLPRFSFFLPVVSKGSSKKRTIAITFDDGPDPVSTPELLRLLSAHGMKAAFFVVGEKAARHPDLVKAILTQGHEVANHSLTHDNLVMFKGRRALKREIVSTQEILARFGIRPLAFRPPVGITYPMLGQVLSQTGMYALNFTCRAMDGGNRWIKGLSKRLLRQLRPGAIMALHDVNPPDERRFSYWLNEVDRILSEIRAQGFKVVPLSELIGRPVMIKTATGGPDTL